MTKQAIIERTLKAIQQLPEEKAEAISDFADFLLKRYDETELNEAIQQYISSSPVFDFLNADEDLYSESDIKKPYNG